MPLAEVTARLAGVDAGGFLYVSLATAFASMTLTMKDGPGGLAARWREFWLRRAGYRPFVEEDARCVQALAVDRPAVTIETRWFKPARHTNESGVEELHLEDRWQDWRATFVSCVYCVAPYCFAGLLCLWVLGGPIGMLVVKVLAGAGASSALFSVGRYS